MTEREKQAKAEEAEERAEAQRFEESIPSTTLDNPPHKEAKRVNGSRTLGFRDEQNLRRVDVCELHEQMIMSDGQGADCISDFRRVLYDFEVTESPERIKNAICYALQAHESEGLRELGRKIERMR